MSEPTPSAVRERILAEHAMLRRMLAGLVAEPSVQAAAQFLDALELHLGVEDEVLAPVLETIDAWGPDRARLMREEHAAQRRELHWMRAQLHEPTGAELRPWLRHMSTRLLRDMDAEERERLSLELLRDDGISVEIDG